MTAFGTGLTGAGASVRAMEESEVRELLTVEGLRLLDALPPYRSGADVVQLSSRLRREGHPPSLIAAVLTQARLREKAVAKFGPFASRMLFTAAGLEQATRLQVAARHAARFRDAGLLRVADLGCGIGGDALALAALDLQVLGVEIDEVTAAIAAYNLAPFPTAEVVVGDAGTADLSDVDAVFLDPARRAPGHDSTTRVDADQYSPSLGMAFAIAEAKPTGIKLGPAFDREEIPTGVEAQWVTVDGETVELSLWSGALARPLVRRAALVIAGDRVAELTAPADSEDPELRPLQGYLHEPAGAVIRSRLIGDLAGSLDAGIVSDRIAYLTGSSISTSPLAASFEIDAELPIDERRIARELRSRGIGRLEVKKRGVDIDPAAFRAKLGLKGDGEATLILTRVAGRRTALLAHRV